MSQNSSESEPSKILSPVQFDHGFHFSTKNGVYLGMTATSLTDFSSKLETVEVESVLYHYPRGDFQKWIDTTLGDTVLAERMCFIKPDLPGEQLRKQLLNMVHKRINELKGPWLSRPE
jgi:hypothetical protein